MRRRDQVHNFGAQEPRGEGLLVLVSGRRKSRDGAKDDTVAVECVHLHSLSSLSDQQRIKYRPLTNRCGGWVSQSNACVCFRPGGPVAYATEPPIPVKAWISSEAIPLLVSFSSSLCVATREDLTLFVFAYRYPHLIGSADRRDYPISGTERERQIYRVRRLRFLYVLEQLLLRRFAGSSTVSESVLHA